MKLSLYMNMNKIEKFIKTPQNLWENLTLTVSIISLIYSFR